MPKQPAYLKSVFPEEQFLTSSLETSPISSPSSSPENTSLVLYYVFQTCLHEHSVVSMLLGRRFYLDFDALYYRYATE